MLKVSELFLYRKTKRFPFNLDSITKVVQSALLILYFISIVSHARRKRKDMVMLLM